MNVTEVNYAIEMTTTLIYMLDLLIDNIIDLINILDEGFHNIEQKSENECIYLLQVYYQYQNQVNCIRAPRQIVMHYLTWTLNTCSEHMKEHDKDLFQTSYEHYSMLDSIFQH